MSNLPATPQDAEVILKLYDLRREAVMREARNFIFGFTPESVDDVMAILSDFSRKENAYLRQVTGYWEMAASLVLRGALNEELARDNFQELLFVYARLEPFIAQVRERSGMEGFAARMQKFVEGSSDAQARVKRFQQRFEAQRAKQAGQPA